MQPTTEQLDLTFAALADPTRRAMLARLRRGPATVTELGAPFAMTQPSISKHLKVLERAGLVRRGRDAQFRPCTLEVAPLHHALAWLDDYRRFQEQSLDRLEAYVAVMKTKEKQRAKRRH